MENLDFLRLIFGGMNYVCGINVDYFSLVVNSKHFSSCLRFDLSKTEVV